MRHSEISRRNLIWGALAAAAAMPSSAKAAMMCGPVDPMRGIQPCEVGLNGLNITARSASTIQEKQNWCWAACIQGVFAWHGCDIDQEQIVSKVFYDAMDMPATGEQIFQAINGVWEDYQGNGFIAQASPLLDTNYSYADPAAAAALSMELRDEFPLIVGTQGHATIVTAMSWINTPFGQQITSITVRDPWPDSPRRRFLSESEFMNINLLMQVRVQPLPQGY